MTDPKPRRRTRSNGEGGVWHDRARGGLALTPLSGPIPLPRVKHPSRSARSVTGKTKAQVARPDCASLQNAVDAGQNPAPPATSPSGASSTPGLLTSCLAPSHRRPLPAVPGRDPPLHHAAPGWQKRLRTLAPSRDVTWMLRELNDEGSVGEHLPPRPLRPPPSAPPRRGRGLRRPQRCRHRLRCPSRSPRAAGRSPPQRPGSSSPISRATGSRPPTPSRSLSGSAEASCSDWAWTDLALEATPPRLTVQRALKRLPGLGLHLDEPKTRGHRPTVHPHRRGVASGPPRPPEGGATDRRRFMGGQAARG